MQHMGFLFADHGKIWLPKIRGALEFYEFYVKKYNVSPAAFHMISSGSLTDMVI
jgi:hypothetical protein